MNRACRILRLPRLLWHYWRWGALLAGVPLLILGVTEMILSFRENSRRLDQIQRAEARAAEGRITEYLLAIERSVRDSASLAFGPHLLAEEDRQLEFSRLLRLQPPVLDLTAIAAGGREVLFVSRSEPDRVNSRRPVDEPPAGATQREAARYGTPSFAEGFDPVVHLSVPGFEPAAPWTLARISLRFLLDVVRQVELGPGGEAFIIDAQGRLIVHPDPSLVLKGGVDTSSPLLGAARELLSSPTGDPVTFRSTGFDGKPVFASALRMPTTNWVLVVAQPADRLLADVRASASRLALLLAAAILAAFLASAWFARRLGDPILGLAAQAREIGRGNLMARSSVQTRDELEQLSTAINQMADALHQSTTNLEGLVAEKTRELQLANEHKSAFLANVSHELRTPLNAVIGFSETLEEELFGKLNDKQREYVADIKSSGEHLLALINELLDLSKIEAGRMELAFEVFDVKAVLDGALSLVRGRAVAGGVKLALQAPESLPELTGDKRRLRQILLNLLSNAVKFTRPGGEVRLEVRDSADMLTLFVSDTGVGIARADLPRLFEPFSQMAGGAARGEGTGLGLALTKRLVELHGGTIEVASEPGQGSTFTVRLPHRPAAKDST